MQKNNFIIKEKDNVLINQKSKNLNTNLIIFLKETNIKITDNFLKRRFRKLNSLALSSIKDNEIKVFHND